MLDNIKYELIIKMLLFVYLLDNNIKGLYSLKGLAGAGLLAVSHHSSVSPAPL